jgi:hypothetical protein
LRARSRAINYLTHESVFRVRLARASGQWERINYVEDPEYKVDVKIDRPQDATKSDGVLVHGYVQDEGHTIAKRTVRIK